MVVVAVMMVVAVMAVTMMVVVVMMMVVVEGAIRRAGVGHRLVHDLLDGARAPPALPAAAETAIDFAGGDRLLGRGHHVADIMVSQDIA
jgi:N-acetylglutamate synthase-like GNAT family acetyltransferase